MCSILIPNDRINHHKDKKIKNGVSRVMQRDLSVVSLWGANGPVNKASHCTISVERRLHTAQYSRGVQHSAVNR